MADRIEIIVQLQRDKAAYTSLRMLKKLVTAHTPKSGFFQGTAGGQEEQCFSENVIDLIRGYVYHRSIDIYSVSEDPP